MKSMIEYMKRLGLTEYQSRTMIVLFCKGEATAKDICTLGGMRHTKIYQVLKSLEDKGFVTYNYSKPREYNGISPGKALNKLLEKREKGLKQLKRCKEKKMEELKSLQLELAHNTNVHPMWDIMQYKQT